MVTDPHMSTYRCPLHLEPWDSQEGPQGPSWELRRRPNRWDFWPLCLFQPEPLYFLMFYKLVFHTICHLKKYSAALNM